MNRRNLFTYLLGLIPISLKAKEFKSLPVNKLQLKSPYYRIDEYRVSRSDPNKFYGNTTMFKDLKSAQDFLIVMQEFYKKYPEYELVFEMKIKEVYLKDI